MRPLTVTWDGGVRFTADIRGHKVTVDQPRQAGGTDAGPMPVELLPAALGTCVAFYVQQFLVTRGLDATGLEVQVLTAGAAHPNRIGLLEVSVSVPKGIPEQYRDAVVRAAQSCTVHHSLTHTPQINVSILESALTS